MCAFETIQAYMPYTTDQGAPCAPARSRSSQPSGDAILDPRRMDLSMPLPREICELHDDVCRSGLVWW